MTNSFRILPTLFAVNVAVLTGCSPPAEVPRCELDATAPVDVTESGPFRVGYTQFEHTYDAPGGVGARTLTVNVWYPTEDTEGEPARYLDLLEDPQSFFDATPAPALSPCGYPVLTHSHGNWGLAGGGAFLMRHFASHGWAVVAPDHTNNTLAELGSDEARPTALRFLRTLDLTAALDAMESLKSHPLEGKLATTRVIASGHSFGAFTAFSIGGAPFDVEAIRAHCDELPSCTEAELEVFGSDLRDSRVVAIVPMAGRPDPTWFGDDGAGKVQVPLLNLTGTADSVDFAPFWDQLGAHDATWIELDGACHESFNLGVPPCSTFDTQEGHSVVSAYALAFARRQLLGDVTVSGIIDGTRALSDRVTVHRK